MAHDLVSKELSNKIRRLNVDQHVSDRERCMKLCSQERIDTCLPPVSRFHLLRDYRTPSPTVAGAVALRTTHPFLSTMPPAHYSTGLIGAAKHIPAQP